MDSRHDNNDVTAPHQKSASIIEQYFEELMRLTYERPVLMRNLVYAAGAGSLFLTTFGKSILNAVGVQNPWATGALQLAGVAGSALSSASFFAQHRMYGFPMDQSVNYFTKRKFGYESALGEVVVNEKELPMLRISADDPFDAGYVEGYMLAEAMRDTMAHINYLYPLMRLKLGAPSNKNDLTDYMQAILQTIPEAYQQEMRGKVKGYNDWLAENKPGEAELVFEYYLLLQMLPDLRNYNVFNASKQRQELVGQMDTQMACTSIAMRLGRYTFFVRVLDWPSYNVAAQYFLQIDRQIKGAKRTIDIGTPLLTGALTMLNENGMLVEMNVAHGKQIKHPNGMPATLYNRFCAEHADNVQQLTELITKDGGPCGAYHLTASDGVETKSFHFYQCSKVEDNHAVDALVQDETNPNLMVVANHGVIHENGLVTKVNHRDSVEREQNIFHLFNHANNKGYFDGYMQKQEKGEFDAKDLMDLNEFLLSLVRLPLVFNRQSVLCALYAYCDGELVDASVAVDNLFAQRQELANFKQLHRPSH